MASGGYIPVLNNDAQRFYDELERGGYFKNKYGKHICIAGRKIVSIGSAKKVLDDWEKYKQKHGRPSKEIGAVVTQITSLEELEGIIDTTRYFLGT